MTGPAADARTAPRCRLCGLPLTPWATIDGYDVYENSRCGHRMVLPADFDSLVERLYDDACFTGGESGYADYLAGAWALRARARRYCRIVRRQGVSGGTALEIGSAAGVTLDTFREYGWKVTGVEPNSTMARFSREHLGVPAIVRAVEDVDLPRDIGLVLMLQVLEHLRSPLDVLRSVHEALAPRGLLLIETWSLSSLFAKMAGFSLVAMGRLLKLITLGNGMSLLRAKYSFFDSSVAGRIADSALGRLALPYPPVDLFWALFAAQRRPV